jgi:thiamine-phosphate pyrophosphorylase
VTTVWGLEGLSNLSSISKHPIVAIGGINESNAEAVIRSGAHGIAVIGAIHDSVCPIDAVKTLRSKIDNYGADNE